MKRAGFIFNLFLNIFQPYPASFFLHVPRETFFATYQHFLYMPVGISHALYSVYFQLLFTESWLNVFLFNIRYDVTHF